MKKALVVINEQHSLLPEQEKILNQKFGGFERINIPASGMKLIELQRLASVLRKKGQPIVVLSPIPALIKFLCKQGADFYIMHNDNREKKELPNGKIIMTVAKTGWQLV